MTPSLWLWAALAAAQEAPPADEEAAREAELFGEPAPEPEPEPEPDDAGDPTADREAALFGEAAPSEAPPADDREAALFGEAPATAQAAPPPVERIDAKIAAQDDTLAIGGQLWLQLQASLDEDLAGADDVALSSPNLLDLFLDARPNDRVRAYARGRLQVDWTVPDQADPNPLFPAAEPTSVLLDQAWVKFDVKRKVYATLGQQRIKWGAGRFWNPTDFLNQQRLDPLAVQDLRTGVALVKLHVPFEAAGANAYAIANLDGARALDEIGGAGRLEWLIGQTELTASAAVRKDQPVRLGADLSSGISVFDVRLEGALLHGNAAPSWKGTWDYTALPPTFPTEVDRDDDWIPQVVAGADVSARYSDQDTFTLGAEYFYNGAGYDDAELYPWLFVAGGYTPLYVGRHYAAAYAMLPGPGRWDDHTFLMSFLANLSDGSALVRGDWRGKLLTWLDTNAFVSRSLGANGELHYRLNLPPMPDTIAGLCALDPECAPYAELLAERIRVPAPTWTVGTGVAVRF